MIESERPPTQVPAEVWRDFARRLAAYASTMGPDDRLVLHVPSGHVDTEVVLEGLAGDGLRYSDANGTREWDATGLSESERLDVLLHSAFGAVHRWQERASLPHPSLLTVTAAGPAACGVGVLRLTFHDDVDPDEVRPPRRPATVGRVRWPDDVTGLMQFTLEYVRERFDAAACIGSDQRIAVTVDGVPLLIRPVSGRPMLRLTALCTTAMRMAMAADVEMNILNRRHPNSRWVRRGREIWQEITVYARPFVPAVLERMIEEFIDDWTATHDDLIDRLGGREP